MRKSLFTLIVLASLVSGCTTVPSHRADRPDIAALTKQVGDAERGFAKTMADRDYAAFQRFLADETIFFSGKTPLRGRQAVAEDWKRYYERPESPFSWEPEMVQVLDSGTLAISYGPVRDPSGKHFANFQSIWRLEAPGVWRVIFDRGDRVCDCPPK